MLGCRKVQILPERLQTCIWDRPSRSAVTGLSLQWVVTVQTATRGGLEYSLGVAASGSRSVLI